jgi:RimJ/RimL family protein N-acetyltransferase
MPETIPDFPAEFETERLTIRAPRSTDAAEIFAAVRETLPELRPWFPWAQEEPTMEGTEASLAKALKAFTLRADFRWLVFLRGQPTLVASSGMHRVDWSVPKLEIGYWARSSFVGHGYVTEAVHGITAFARQHWSARRVEIRMDSKNERSRRVAVRSGFLHEGTLRNDSRGVNGDLRDCDVFAKVF